MMEKKEFRGLFKDLFFGKNPDRINVSFDAADVFYQKLSESDNIKQIFEISHNIDFKSGMPTIADLLRLDKEINERKLKEKEYCARVQEKARGDAGHTDKSAFLKFRLAADLFCNFSIKPEDVLSFMDENKTPVPENYASLRETTNIREFLKQNYFGLINSCRKLKLVGGTAGAALMGSI